jgi:transaldolase
MSLLIDSADVEDIRRALALGFVTGVTTNPALIARTGRPGMDVLKDILRITDGPVFFQVTADTVEHRAEQAWDISRLAPQQIHVKIPATTENIALAAHLSKEGIQCAVTAVSSPGQAYMAGLAGATYIAPYVNRMTRSLGNGVEVVRRCAALLQGTRTRIVAASLKSVDEVIETLLAGAHDVTIPLDLILALGEHELSQQAIRDFAAATAAAAG